MLTEPTKSDKKVAQKLISIALQREVQTILNEYFELLQKWKNETPEDSRGTYNAHYKTVRENNKYLTQQYDMLRPAWYFDAITNLLANKILTEHDLADFSDQVKNELITLAKRRKEY
nr:hypothetical protein [Pedobacter panaciterrae]